MANFSYCLVGSPATCESSFFFQTQPVCCPNAICNENKKKCFIESNVAKCKFVALLRIQRSVERLSASSCWFVIHDPDIHHTIGFVFFFFFSFKTNVSCRIANDSKRQLKTETDGWTKQRHDEYDFYLDLNCSIDREEPLKGELNDDDPPVVEPASARRSWKLLSNKFPCSQACLSLLSLFITQIFVNHHRWFCVFFFQRNENNRQLRH